MSYTSCHFFHFDFPFSFSLHFRHISSDIQRLAVKGDIRKVSSNVLPIQRLAERELELTKKNGKQPLPKRGIFLRTKGAYPKEEGERS